MLVAKGGTLPGVVAMAVTILTCMRSLRGLYGPLCVNGGSLRNQGRSVRGDPQAARRIDL